MGRLSRNTETTDLVKQTSAQWGPLPTWWRGYKVTDDTRISPIQESTRGQAQRTTN